MKKILWKLQLLTKIKIYLMNFACLVSGRSLKNFSLTVKVNAPGIPKMGGGGGVSNDWCITCHTRSDPITKIACFQEWQDFK